MYRNVTIATFAEHAFYKAEAFGANLRGPKTLNDHGLHVALKSVRSFDYEVYYIRSLRPFRTTALRSIMPSISCMSETRYLFPSV